MSTVFNREEILSSADELEAARKNELHLKEAVDSVTMQLVGKLHSDAKECTVRLPRDLSEANCVYIEKELRSAGFGVHRIEVSSLHAAMDNPPPMLCVTRVPPSITTFEWFSGNVVGRIHEHFRDAANHSCQVTVPYPSDDKRTKSILHALRTNDIQSRIQQSPLLQPYSIIRCFQDRPRPAPRAAKRPCPSE